jgi:lysophospholipase L1-like esterase
MNGGAVASYALVSPPLGLTTLRDGLDTTGVGPTTIVRRKAAFAVALPDSQLQSKSLKPQSGSLWCVGDSFTAGQVTGQTFSDSYPSRAGRLLSRRYFNAGVGGETSSQILTRVQTEKDRLNWIAVFEAGRNDGTSNPSLIYSNIAAMIACLPSNGRYLVWSVPYALNDTQPTKDAIAAINAQLLATYGNRFINIDWSTVTRVADNLHPDDAGLATMAAAAQAAIVALGWT